MDESPFIRLDAGARLERFTPLNGFIVVRRDLESIRTRGVLYVPKADEDTRAEVCEAEVLAVGPGWASEKRGRVEPPGLRPGDRVLIPRYCGHDVMNADGDLFVIMDWRQVLTVIERTGETRAA